MEHLQLGLARREAEEAEGGAEGGEALVAYFHQPSRAICRRIFNARRSYGFTCGHASWPHVVDVIERIRNRTRTQGRRWDRWLALLIFSVVYPSCSSTCGPGPGHAGPA